VNSSGSNGFGDRLFWTAALPDSDVQFQFGAGKAAMHVSSLATLDYPSLPVSVGAQWQTSFVTATISFDVVWNGPVTRRINIRDGSNGNQFAGEFLENEATVSWWARNNTGFSFRSNPGDFSTSVRPFAELGRERNGSFFQSESPPMPSVGARSSPFGETTLATPLAQDALLDFVKRPDGTLADWQVVTQFNCLHRTGNLCPSMSDAASRMSSGSTTSSPPVRISTSSQQSVVDDLFALLGMPDYLRHLGAFEP
jgi:hypothetical protein